MDYSQIPTDDLLALRDNNLKKVSTKTLVMLRQGGGGGDASVFSGLQPLPSHSVGGMKPVTIAPPTLRERLTPSRKTVAKMARPVLEGVGAGLGAAGGSAVAPIAGTVVGAALGYGMGSGLADIIEGPEATQVRLPATPDSLEMPHYRPRTLTEEAGHHTKNLITGAEMEMGGQVIGKVAGHIANELVDAGAKGMPLSKKRALYKAAQEYEQAYTPSRLSASQNKLTQARTEGTMQRIGADVSPTTGQTTNDFNARKFEQAKASKDVAVEGEPSFGEQLLHNDATIRKAATKNMLTEFGHGGELPQEVPTDIVGENMATALSKGKVAAKAAQRKVWADVQPYPTPHDQFIAADQKIAGTSMPDDSRNVVDGIRRYAKEELDKNPNVQGLQSVDRTIGRAIKKANRAGDEETVRHLRVLQQGVQDDFNTLGEAADRGDIALSGGKVIVPSQLRGEVARIDEQLTKAQEKAATPDYDVMAARLRAGGAHSSTFSKVDKQDTGVEKRITEAFQRKFPGEPLPVKGSATSDPLIDNLTTRRTALQAQLDAAQPADDMAKAYSAAKKYSREEVFKKYYRGAVQDVLASGNQASGRQIINENIPARFTTSRTGARDFRRGLVLPKGTVDPATGEVMSLPERITAANDAAAKLAMPQMINKLIEKTVRNNGVMDVVAAKTFLRQNAEVLHELGIYDSMRGVIKDQIPNALKDYLEATGKVDIQGNPEMTALQAYKMMRKLAPAVRETYGMNSKAMQSLKDYAEALRILGRNKNVTAVGGSTTVEKATGDNVVGFAKKLSALMAVISGHGWTYSASENLLGSIFKGRLAVQRLDIDRFIRDAVFNPEAREALMKVAKAKPADVSAVATKYLMPFIRQMQIGPESDQRGGAGIGANIKAGIEAGAGAALGGMNLLKGGGN